MTIRSHQLHQSEDCSRLGVQNFKMSSQSSLRQETFELKATLELLEVERRSLLEHFKIQEDNYAATFKAYVEKLGLLLKEQENQIDELSKEKSRLEARISFLEASLAGEDFSAPQSQYFSASQSSE